MASRKPHIPSYRLHKARRLAVVTIDGKDVYLGRYNSPESKEFYRRLIAAWVARLQPPLAKNQEALDRANAPLLVPVNELILAFVTHAEKYYRLPDGTATTELAEYRRTLGLLRELYGRTPISEFGPNALKTVRNQMIQLDWSRGVVNQRIGRIKRVFKWGVENELVEPAVFQGLAAVAGLKRGRSGARETASVKPHGQCA